MMAAFGERLHDRLVLLHVLQREVLPPLARLQDQAVYTVEVALVAGDVLLPVLPEDPPALRAHEVDVLGGHLRGEDVARHQDVHLVLDLGLSLLVADALVALELVVEHRERLFGRLVAAENEGYVAALPPHVREVDQRRVQPDHAAALVDLADVRGQDARHQRHPRLEVPLQLHVEVAHLLERLHQVRPPLLHLLFGLLFQLLQQRAYWKETTLDSLDPNRAGTHWSVGRHSLWPRPGGTSRPDSSLSPALHGPAADACILQNTESKANSINFRLTKGKPGMRDGHGDAEHFDCR